MKFCVSISCLFKIFYYFFLWGEGGPLWKSLEMIKTIFFSGFMSAREAVAKYSSYGGVTVEAKVP